MCKIIKKSSGLNKPVFKNPSSASVTKEIDCSPTNFQDISKIEKQISIASSNGMAMFGFDKKSTLREQDASNLLDFEDPDVYA